MPPTKIMVTGNAGSGKTTLARAIAGEFRLPVFPLDAVVWESGWRKRAADEKHAAIEALIRTPAWVIDGVSEAVEQAADVVVFLDVPPLLCLWRCAKRNARYLLRSRPELPDGCPEWRIALRLPGLITRFDHIERPTIADRAGADVRYVRLPSCRDDASIIALLHST